MDINAQASGTLAEVHALRGAHVGSVHQVAFAVADAHGARVAGAGEAARGVCSRSAARAAFSVSVAERALGSAR